MPNRIFRDEVLFSIGQRSFFSFFFLLVEAEAEAEAVDRLAASTSLREVHATCRAEGANKFLRSLKLRGNTAMPHS